MRLDVGAVGALIAKDIVSATSPPNAHSRSSRARNRRANGPPRSWSSMTIGRAFCCNAAINCDLRDTRTGTGGGGFGGATLM